MDASLIDLVVFSFVVVIGTVAGQFALGWHKA